ncbi:hypothetical protein FH972_021167 [Carpinus fangiana]|uniref:Uncharacterized protein n=1 Tax=Carpinus fangiana TaxID=176857 RepID=A0A5N6KNJ8_9ROSI|nr:hypothetical protein FH972_021167 [Carpinus fangiana]
MDNVAVERSRCRWIALEGAEVLLSRGDQSSVTSSLQQCRNLRRATISVKWAVPS